MKMSKLEMIEKAIYIILAILLIIFGIPLEKMLPVEEEEEKVALVIKNIILRSKLSDYISKSELLKYISESKSLNYILKSKLLKYILKLKFFSK
jgi:hypothetical protein